MLVGRRLLDKNCYSQELEQQVGIGQERSKAGTLGDGDYVCINYGLEGRKQSLNVEEHRKPEFS